MLKNNHLFSALLLLVCGATTLFTQANELMQNPSSEQQVITRAGQINVINAPATNFTGNAHFSRFPIMPTTGNVAPAIVTFSANSRTHWHIHHHGQYLIVTEGEGRIQAWGSPVEVIKKGDVVWCPPGVKHWHGASPDQGMTHIAISPVAETSPSVTWLEKVEFTEAPSSKIQSQQAKQLISATTPLTAKQLSIIPIASYTASGNLVQLKIALNEALNLGLTINEIKEVLSHLYAYAGFPRSLNGLTTLQAVLTERQNQGITDQPGAEPTPPAEDINYYQLGTQTMEFITQASAQRPIFEFSPSIDYALKAHLFGYLFSRDNLSYINRELVTISVLSTLSLDDQLRSHLRAGKNLGMTALQFNQIIQTLEPVSPQAAVNVKTLVEKM